MFRSLHPSAAHQGAVILERSGIECEPRLFVDPVLTVAAHRPKAWQCNEIEMPFVVQREHYILSPYFDWISFLFNHGWRHPIQDIIGIMIKLADENVGSISGGKIVHYGDLVASARSIPS